LSALFPDNPYQIPVIRKKKKKDKFVQIFGWCYTITMGFAFLIGWIVGDLIR